MAELCQQKYKNWKISHINRKTNISSVCNLINGSCLTVKEFADEIEISVGSCYMVFMSGYDDETKV